MRLQAQAYRPSLAKTTGATPLVARQTAVQQDGQEDSKPPVASRHGLYPRHRAVASRLGRRRPLPRTALGFGNLFSSHVGGNGISDSHGPVAVITGEL